MSTYPFPMQLQMQMPPPPSSSSSSSSANANPSAMAPQPTPLKSAAASANPAPAAPQAPPSGSAAPPLNWHQLAAMNPAINPFLAALAAANHANQGAVNPNPSVNTSMLPNAQPAPAQIAAAAGLAPFPPQMPMQTSQANAVPPPPFFPPNLPYAGLAAMGYPTQSTLAASALLSGLPLPGALPTPQPPPPPPPPAPQQSSAASVPLSAGSAALPPGFNLATSPWLANLGLSASMLNSLGANPLTSNGLAPSAALSSSSSSPTQADGTPSSPVASAHNALATTSKRPPPSSFSTAMVHSSSSAAAAAASSSDLGSPPPSDPSTSLVAPKPLSASSSALATVSAQVKAAAAASDTLMVKPGAQPNGTSQASMTLTKNLSQFLLKLYNMVDDPTTDDLIHWSDAGTSFVVEHAEELAKGVLPKFFKHSNFSSFVRQLNMYSFRKVTHITQGSLTGNSDDHRWEFSNDHFIRGLPDQLCFITRKKASAATAHDGGDAGAAGALAGTSSSAAAASAGAGDMSNVLVEVSNVRKHQLTLSSEQKELQAHVQLLWRDMLSTKDQVARQQVTIDKILRFLASLYSAKDAKGGAGGGVGNNKLATDGEVGGGAAGSGREPEQSGARKRKLQLLEYNPMAAAAVASGSGSRHGSPAGSPAMMDLDGFPEGVGVADIEQLPDSPTSPAMRVPPMRLEEVHDNEDALGGAEVDDGMDVDGIRVTSSAAAKRAKGKAKAKASAAPSPTRRASKSSASGSRRSAAKSSSATNALEAVASAGTVLSPPPTKAARKSNRTAGTASKSSGGRSSRASSSASSTASAAAAAAANGHASISSPATQAAASNSAPYAPPHGPLLPMDLPIHHPTSSFPSPPAPAQAPVAAPTPEERLLWLTSETSRLGSNVHSLNPAIDDLTSTAAAELAGATDLDLDVLLGSLPDLSSSSTPASALGAAAAPPPAAPTPGGMQHMSHDAIMALLHHPNAMAMLAAVQGGAGAPGAGPHPDWTQLGAAGAGQGKMMSPAQAGAGAATAPSPNLGDLSAFLSFESDNDGDAAMGE